MPKDLFHKIISNADFWSLFLGKKLPRFTSPGIVSFCYVSLPMGVFHVGEFQELTRGTWWGATGSIGAQARCFAGWRGCCHGGSMGLVNVYLTTQIRPLFWLVKALFLGGFTFKNRGHWGIHTYPLNGWFSWLMLNVCKYTPQDRRNFECLWQENVLGKSKFRDSVIFKTSSVAFCIPRCFFLGGLDLFVGAGLSN